MTKPWKSIWKFDDYVRFAARDGFTECREAYTVDSAWMLEKLAELNIEYRYISHLNRPFFALRPADAAALNVLIMAERRHEDR